MTNPSGSDPLIAMQRLRDQMLRGWGVEFQGHFVPAVDIYEADDTIEVTVELPGIRPDEVRINVEKNALTISGERKLEHADKRECYRRIEAPYGPFTRSFTLPESADPDKV